MLKLMKLEMRKYKLGGYIKGALIANIVIMFFLIVISYVSKVEKNLPFGNYQMVLTMIETFVRGTFIVFASVLISRLIIDEFKSKSITVLFMYPINRKKLILAKLFIIVLFTFCSIIVSLVILTFGFSIFNSLVHILPGNLTMVVIADSALSMIMNAVEASVMCLIPLYFGMRKYSGSTTIISSLIIVLIVCQNYGGTSLNSIIVIPITLALIGAYVAYLSIKDIEHVDVL
ncbi:ABC transporter permease [Brevibacillus formosus]|uniref:ABC transporter permease n=1 Tax=Brevibacillus formosus TaxID=54913 RepID=UPI003F1BCCE3